MNRQIYSSFLLILVSLTGWTSSLWGYCNDNQYWGITSQQPLMSTIDVSSSTFYSTTSTSGTSGCPNWDFAQHLAESRKKFLNHHHQMLLEEASQGQGPHLAGLGRLMGCPLSEDLQFATMLKNYYVPLMKHLSVSGNPHTTAFLTDLQHWIAQDAQLKNACKMTG